MTEARGTGWRRVADTYREPRLLAVLFMGFSSGLPLPLIISTLSFWLAQSGVSRTAIGLFALIGIPYNFKFLWSPLIDRLPLPVLTRLLGRRRSWALLLQALLAAAILGLGLTDPKIDAAQTALMAVIVAFLSASQDIVIDAYRIELLAPGQQGAGAAATQWGYRFGMIAGGAGALYASAFDGWHFAYAVMAGLMGVGMVTVWLTPEPEVPAVAAAGRGAAGVVGWLRSAVVAPLADFFTRDTWVAILLFVVLYKFGDALAGVMSSPLYVSLGFTAGEVAAISKVFGVIMTLVGVALGGVAVARWGLFPSLLVCGVLQNVSTLMYAALAAAGHDNTMLAVSIALENITGGLGSAAFVAYMSRLCNLRFTATQYALLSSLAAVGRTMLAASGGYLADKLDWVWFFTLATFAGLPGLLVLLWLMRRERGLDAGEAMGAVARG
ncbi:MAG TPA: AmpG family muropeptide MFS transporter [Alphaproteobacteria bacterium]|nr:AmpG family muropeptide MFS transporter [Alphaproteobacteria bacterium]